MVSPAGRMIKHAGRLDCYDLRDHLEGDDLGEFRESDGLPATRRWLVGAFAVLFTAPVWLFDRLPMQDLPNHLAITATLAAQGSTGGWHDVFENRLALKPYSGYTWATLLIGRLVGIELAGRLVLTLYLLGSIWAFSALVRRRGSPLTPLLALPLLYSDFYLIGMVSFLISLPLLVGCVILAKRAATSPAWASVALALCSTALVLAHPFSWLFGVFLVLASLEGLRPRLIGAACLIPSALVFTQGLGSRAVLGDAPTWPEPAFKLRYLLTSPAMVAEAADRTLFAGGVVLWLGLLAVAAARSRRGSGAAASDSVTSRRAWMLVAGLASAYFAAPFAVGAAVWLDGRVAVFFWGALLFALAPWVLRTRIETLAATLACLLIFSAILKGHRAFDDEIAPLAEIIEAMPSNARVLWLPFDRTSQAFQPFYQESAPYTLYAHAGSYYHVEKGGSSPSMTFHAALPWIPLGLKDELYRRAFTVNDPFAPERLVAERAPLLKAFDFLLVRGAQGRSLDAVAEPLLWVEDYALYRPRR